MTHVARAIPQPDEGAIACHQVTFQIGKKQILSEVNFAVQQGKIADLLGPNGAGKSTLLRIIAGIPPLLRACFPLRRARRRQHRGRHCLSP